MKTILLTAAALTLGTSAFAWAPVHEDIHATDARQASVVPAAFAGWTDPSVAESRQASVVPAAFAGWTDPSVSEGGAALGMKTGTDGLTFADADIKSKAMVGGVMTASAVATQGAKTDTDGLTFADADIKSKAMVGGVMTASTVATQGAKTDTDGLTFADADIKSKAMVGGAAAMGGPIEEAQGYPACRPGRGDDNCIQLYERGVSGRLAAYKASEGAEIGVGGPYEPAADTKPASTAPAPNSGPKVPNDGGKVESDEGEADPHAGHDMSAPKPGATATPTPNRGVGGPYEAQSYYPPCSRTVTDSCTQAR
jgi:hypothetical protein